MNRFMCRTGFALTFLSILVSCSREDSGKASEEDLVRNPEYVHWAKFKPGSYSVLKQVSIIARTKAQGFSRVILKEVSETGVVVQIHHFMPNPTPDATVGPGQRRFIPAMISRSTARRGVEVEGNVGKGEELLRHGDETLTTHWFETSTQQGVLSMWSKVWYCDDIPNRVVKEMATMKGAKTKIEKTLVEYKVVE